MSEGGKKWNATFFVMHASDTLILHKRDKKAAILLHLPAHYIFESHTARKHAASARLSQEFDSMDRYISACAIFSMLLN